MFDDIVVLHSSAHHPPIADRSPLKFQTPDGKYPLGGDKRIQDLDLLKQPARLINYSFEI